MADQAEEKKLPASDKKLRDARRKGQVSQSRDFVSGFGLCGTLAYLYAVWPLASRHLLDLVQTIAAAGASPQGATAQAFHHAFMVIMLITLPMVGIIVGVTLIFGVLATFGPVFSFEPLKLQFEHINPAKGLKKIVSLRNVIEFVKGLAKVLLLAGVLSVVLVVWLKPSFQVPACGLLCILPLTSNVLLALAVAAGLTFLVIGLLDVPIQRWLFLRDMRMTTTEYRREHRDLEGDPTIRQERKRQRREVSLQTNKLGIHNAVIAFTSGDTVVALRYVKGETGIPAVVAKAQGREAAAMVAKARAAGMPIVEDAPVTRSLYEKTANGAYINQDMYSPIARYLIRHGLT